MLINEYVALNLHKVKELELKSEEARGNRALAEIIMEFKSEARNRRVRKANRR